MNGSGTFSIDRDDRRREQTNAAIGALVAQLLPMNLLKHIIRLIN
jgi:hypothetical protein